MALPGIRSYERKIEDHEGYQSRKWIRTPDHNEDAQFNLGREVFLIPIAWDYDGWPLVDNHNNMMNLEGRRLGPPYFRPLHYSGVDNFEEEVLDMIWCTRRPVQNPFYSLTVRPRYLRVELSHVRLEDMDTPAMLVQRQRHYNFQMVLAMEFEPLRDGGEVELVLTQNECFSFFSVKEIRGGRVMLNCYRLVNGVKELLRSAETGSGQLYFIMEGTRGSYDFYYRVGKRQKTAPTLGEDGLVLNTLVTDGFVGTYLGVYASTGHKAPHSHADFDWFRYGTIEE